MTHVHGTQLDLVLAWQDDSFAEPAVELSCSTAKKFGDSQPSNGILEGDLRVTLTTATIDRWFYCFGYDLSEFAEQLERFHRELAGQAEFTNQEGSVRVLLSMANRGKGRIAVGGEVELLHETGHGDEPLSGLFKWPGGRFVFDGLVIDQSFVPALLQELVPHQNLWVHGSAN